MMPSLDHCITNAPEMTTLTNTLEVFDTYKHREDKDSDEESFHLPLDDDESETKPQEPVKNGNSNDSEDEILNKFDSTVAAVDAIDSQLEEHLLNEDDEEKKELKTDNVSKHAEAKLNTPKVVENGDSSDLITCQENNKVKEEICVKDKENVTEQSKDHDLKDLADEQEECSSVSTDLLNHSTEKASTEDDSNSDTEKAIKNGVECSDVPIVEATNEKETTRAKNESAIDTLRDNLDAHVEVDKSVDTRIIDKSVDASSEEDKPASENVNKELNAVVEPKDETLLKGKKETDTNSPNTLKETSGDDKAVEKCENSNDSTKSHNEDSEDLFDISIIRDAEEDNAESAYNEAHPEGDHVDENEDYDERSDEKMEEDCVNEKTNNVEGEDDDEMDIDKHEDQIRTDDVEIEEENLTYGVKDTVSDGESENINNTELVRVNNEQKTEETTTSSKKYVTECRLDEVTGKLISGENINVNSEDEGSALDKETDKTTEDPSTKKSLKRPISEEDETGTAKKSRTENVPNVEIKEVEKLKEKLPLRALLSLSDFMKTRKNNRRLSMHDLEEFCVQKICEAIVHKSELGDVHHQLKLQEQLIETMRKEIQQLTKQARDLEIVNKKLMNDLKQQTATQKPLNPLKITRSVGLQVKFTPVFESNLKRRQPNATVVNQKIQVQTTPNRGLRTVSTAVTSPSNRQVTPPQKQPVPQLTKPSTPLLSQALQSRRTGVNDSVNKIPNSAPRPKPPADTKNAAPTASVIDLTDEDDKKDKNKTSTTKIMTPKNITVPLRTTPMRVNATAQGIRLTTSQGKGSPITSVVTSSAPQVMYVVQSSPQNVLTGGPKAVVVNFQSANGVITSALNGSAVSVIPKQGNTIQLKTVATPKPLQNNNKSVKAPMKHPAPLPNPPITRISTDKPLKPVPPKPHLTIRKTDTGIILQWKMPYELEMYEVIASYQLYAYQETSAMPSTDMWRKVGDVKALALPMACTLTQFADKNKYYFAVRPVDIHKRIGQFSDPEEISL